MKIICTGCDGRGYDVKAVGTTHGFTAALRVVCKWCTGTGRMIWKNKIK